MRSKQGLWVGDSQEDVADRIKPSVTPTTSATEKFGKRIWLCAKDDKSGHTEAEF